jgi:hypothetical protein
MYSPYTREEDLKSVEAALDYLFSMLVKLDIIDNTQYIAASNVWIRKVPPRKEKMCGTPM